MSIHGLVSSIVEWAEPYPKLRAAGFITGTVGPALGFEAAGSSSGVWATMGATIAGVVVIMFRGSQSERRKDVEQIVAVIRQSSAEERERLLKQIAALEAKVDELESTVLRLQREIDEKGIAPADPRPDTGHGPAELPQEAVALREMVEGHPGQSPPAGG